MCSARICAGELSLYKVGFIFEEGRGDGIVEDNSVECVFGDGRRA